MMVSPSGAQLRVRRAADTGRMRAVPSALTRLGLTLLLGSLPASGLSIPALPPDTLPESLDRESNDDAAHAQQVQLPVIVNGRMDRANDEDVFQVEARAGDSLVAEVTARRLDSPLDSLRNPGKWHEAA